MEISQPANSTTDIRQPRRRRHNRIPPDTVLYLLFFIVLLPLGIRADWFQPAGRLVMLGDKVLLYLALAFGLLGSSLLAVARIPIYITRHHHGFRPRELPDNYRRLFWVSYVLILISFALLLCLGIMQRC